MNSAPFQNYTCWKQERISQVINKEAVAVEKADFLATHVPLSNITYIHTPHSIDDISEQGLLQELCHCAKEDRHAFVVVQGIPGTGKSHLIRWMKERYEVANREMQGHAAILLIERAQCNLRGTLQQIIQSGIFEGESLQRHLEKLKGATSALSKKALENTLLEELLIATTEVPLPEEQKPQPLIQRNIEKFLLDYNVREHLKRKNGPIDRIMRFLSVGSFANMRSDDLIGFRADDFLFSSEIEVAMRSEGYKAARELVQHLSPLYEHEIRDELASYLNRLLNYAIERTTALSAEDLKQMFNELRQYLRKQNRQLALFIEDITAFTGIDAGLIDVLATQHTGESNKEFCRLLSVIGVTDGYYEDKFPDNMKERVTHLITLDIKRDESPESDLLTTPEGVAELASRYLNAMRLEQDRLQDWSEGGAQLDQLPNACDGCQFKAKCHGAFGFVELGTEGSKTQQIGLYPFNKKALWTMYKNIYKNSRTPRSLLNSILLYILESYGSRVKEGQFPPSYEKLGNDFRTPSLKKFSQRVIIDDQGGDDARRIELLVLFWGDGTVDVTIDLERRLIGELPEEVFYAFGIRFITGDTLSSSTSYTTSTSAKEAETATPGYSSNTSLESINTPLVPISSTRTANTPVLVLAPFQTQTQQGKLKDDISEWYRGERLQNYEKFRDWLVTYIESFVDWETHGISSIQIEDRLKPGKIAIVGQVGQIYSDNILFERSIELALVLQALVDLNINEAYQQLDSDTLAGHWSILSIWLHQQEEKIIDFVRRPTNQSKLNLSITQILALNCAILTCLRGRLADDSYNVQELQRLIIQDCAQVNTLDWQRSIDKAQQTHSSTWVELMRGVNNIDRKINSVSFCYKNLLLLFNRVQGQRGKVFFVDTATFLDLLTEFDSSDWNLPLLGNVGDNIPEVWRIAVEIYKSLQNSFMMALNEDRENVRNTANGFKELMGSSLPEEVLRSIASWVDCMRNSQRGHNFEQKFMPDDAQELSSTLKKLQVIVDEKSKKQLALLLSNIDSTMKDAQEYTQYLRNFQSRASEQVKSLAEYIEQLRAEVQSFSAPSTASIEEIYSSIEQNLLHFQEDK